MLLLSGVAFGQGSADWYVDTNLTTGNQDGQSWANAFTDLDSGLQAATNGQSIWVAIGTYETQIGTGRSKTFTIPNGVSLFGGFVNGDQTLPGSAKYRETILSGDIDVGGVPTADAYHVVTVQSGQNPVGIDGFVITGGVADGLALFAQDQGGGIRCVGSDLVLRNCVITTNFANDGGASSSRARVQKAIPSQRIAVRSRTIGPRTKAEARGSTMCAASRPRSRAGCSTAGSLATARGRLSKRSPTMAAAVSTWVRGSTRTLRRPRRPSSS
ncbi:MAG: hypothetical protein DRJ50_13635 [Actinobacteria bacterium]|nr:MAG: hypothetical protein DRJ50_13635 [Actinomycetota bacterium]